MPDLRSLRIAVVGAGVMGRWHAYFARRLGMNVAAIVDSETDAARSLARRGGRAAVFSELGPMLETVRPHVVHVCTPLPTHFPLAFQVIDSGAHALVEKPLTHTVDQTQSLLSWAEERGVHVCPAHQFGFQRGVAHAAKALADLGDALAANFTICSAGGGARTGAALDEIVANILPHPFSVLQVLWPGNPLQPQDWTAQSERHGELRANGRTGAIAVSIYISMSARPTRCELEILCTGGSIHLNFFHGYAVVRRGDPSRLAKVAQPFVFAGVTFGVAATNLAGRTGRRELAYPGLHELIRRFYVAAGGHGENPIPAPDMLSVAILREHLIRDALPDLLPAFATA